MPTKPYLQNPAPENPTRVESQQREQYRDRIESDAFRQERGDSLRAPDRTSPRQIDRQRSLRGERSRLNHSPIR